MDTETTDTRHRRKRDSVAATTEWTARLRDDPDAIDAFVAAWQADAEVVAELVVRRARIHRETWIDEARQIALIELWDLGREITEKDIGVRSVGGTLYRRATLQFQRFHRSTAGDERVSGVVAWRRRDSARQQVRDAMTESLGRPPTATEMVAESRRRFVDREQVVADLTDELGRRPSTSEIATACEARHGHPGVVRPFQMDEINFLPALSLDRPVADDSDVTFGDRYVDDATDHRETMVHTMRHEVVSSFEEPEATVARMFFDDSGATTAADAVEMTGITARDARRVLTEVRERARRWWSEAENGEGPDTDVGAFA